MQAKYDARNPAALKQLVGQKVKVLPFPKDVMELAFKESMALYEEISAKNPNWKKVYDDYANFRRDRSDFGKGFTEVLNTDAPGLRVVRRVEDTKCLCPSDICNRPHARRHLCYAFRTHGIIRRQQLLRRTKVNRTYRKSSCSKGINAFLGWIRQVDAVKASTRTPNRKLWKWEPAACPWKP